MDLIKNVNNMACCCDICAEIKALFANSAPISSDVYISLFDEANGCSRTTLANLLGSSLAATDDQDCTDKKKIGSIDIVGTVTDFFESVTGFGTPIVDATTDPSNVKVTLPFTDEKCVVNPIEFTVPIPTPVSVYNSIDLKFDANGDLIVEAVYTNDAGVTSTITDTTPIALPPNEDYVLYAANNAVPSAAPPDGVDTTVLANGDRYDWNGTAWVLVPSAVLPVYTTCDGTPLTTADKIATAPAGTYTSGYTVNQADANGCLTRSDIYYNLARRSHTFGDNYMANDAQGYGSSVTGGIRNTTATAAGYSHIGGGYDHSITTGTANTIGGGRDNDITAGNYNGIAMGYNQNITAGSYNTIAGGASNDIKAGSSNTIVGGIGIDFEAGTGSYNVAGGINHTFNGGSGTTAFGTTHTSDGGLYGFMVGQLNKITAGNYVSQLGYSHENTVGSATTQLGYNHTNVAGNYNTQSGYAHTITVGQSITQGGQSNINTAGNQNSQFGIGHLNSAGNGNFQGGYDHNITNSSYTSQLGYRQSAVSGNYHTMFGTNNLISAGNYNTTIGNSHIVTTGTGNSVFGWNNTVTAGSYSFMGSVNSTHTSGNYNAMLGYVQKVDGTGNMLFGFNNSATTNYSVTIGRNLVNTTQDGIMIANSFQKLGFHGATPVARVAVNDLAQLLAFLKLRGDIL